MSLAANLTLTRGNLGIVGVPHAASQSQDFRYIEKRTLMSHHVLNSNLKITELLNCYVSYSLYAILRICSFKEYGEMEENN